MDNNNLTESNPIEYGGFTCSNLYEVIDTLNKYKVKPNNIIHITNKDERWYVIYKKD